MTMDEIVQRYQTQPFVPFDLRLRNGRSVRVGQKFALCFDEGDDFVVVNGDQERFDIVRLGDIIRADRVA